MNYKEFLNYKSKNKKDEKWYEDAKKKLDTLDYFLKTDGLKGFNIISYFVKSNLIRWDSELFLIRNNADNFTINCGKYEEKGCGYDVQADSIIGLIRSSIIIHRLIDLSGNSDKVNGLYTPYFSMNHLYSIEDVKDLFKALGFETCINSYVDSGNNKILNLLFLNSSEKTKPIGLVDWDVLEKIIDDYMICRELISYNPATEKYDGDFAIYDLSEEVDLDYFKKSGKSIQKYADEILENWNYDYWNSELYDERDRLIAYLDEGGHLTHYSGEFEGALSSYDEWEEISDYFFDIVKNCPDKEELIAYIKKYL